MIYWVKKFFSDPHAHLSALYEVLTTAFFSLAPFLVSAFVQTARAANGQGLSLSTFFGKGQLYLLAYSVFGTIFWLAFLRSDRERHGARAFLGLIATVLIIPVIGFLGVDPTFTSILNPDIVKLGYWFYAALLLLNYLLLFYIDVEPPQPSDVLNRESGDMRSRYREMKRHG